MIKRACNKNSWVENKLADRSQFSFLSAHTASYNSSHRLPPQTTPPSNQTLNNQTSERTLRQEASRAETIEHFTEYTVHLQSLGWRIESHCPAVHLQHNLTALNLYLWTEVEAKLARKSA